MFSIFLWNDDNGCWDFEENFAEPKKDVNRHFLFWKWKEKVSVLAPVEVCRAAVAHAKDLQSLKKVGVRVKCCGDVVWQNGQWKIDTNTYDFYPDYR